MLWVGTGASVDEAVAAILPQDAPQGTVILPSTQSRRDRLAAAVRTVLRGRGTRSHLVVPTGSGLLPGVADWQPVTIAPPDRPAIRVSLPARLVNAPECWIVTDVDAVSGRGPQALDLLARYLHPRDRARLLLARDRAAAAVDVNLAAPVAWHLTYRRFPGFVLAAATADPIVAELFALSLAEENLPAHLGVEGVWEDRVVQRATELDLGIQVPDQLVVTCDDTSRFPNALNIVSRLVLRMGVRIS